MKFQPNEWTDLDAVFAKMVAYHTGSNPFEIGDLGQSSTIIHFSNSIEPTNIITHQRFHGSVIMHNVW